jgi:tetratricopeptide (TPR) repeat protein
MFTTALLGHYTPLTWLTLTLDHAMWGMAPRGYHLTSLLLHAATAAAFALVAHRLLRGRPHAWLGAAVAALLFALHPLRVESVAWVTERRDVLSGGLYVLTILLYLRYADGRAGRAGYLAAVGTFALALLSKSMAVSLPVVLIVLDVYPLGRLGGPTGWTTPGARRVWLEKVPFIVLAAAAAAVTFVAMHSIGNLAPTAVVTVPERVAVALYALAFYLWKTVVPLGLSPIYERPVVLDPLDWRFVVAGAGVLALTVLAVVRARRWPALTAAWIVYLAVLLPVLGLFQTAYHLAADRYTYLATLPWALLASAGLLAIGDALERRVGASMAWRSAGAAGGLALLILAVLTWRQVQVWHDSQTLWTHALTVSPSALAHYNLGAALMAQRRRADAMAHYRQALEINPRHADAHTNLGAALLEEGHVREALPHVREALAHYAVAVDTLPGSPRARYNQALAFAHAGDIDAAIDGFRTALRLDPDYTDAHYNLGVALGIRGRWPEAVAHYREAARRAPTSARIRLNLGVALSHAGQLDAAVAELREALRIDPAYAKARIALGSILVRQRHWREAAQHLEEALRAAPDSAEAHRRLGIVLANEARWDEAAGHLRRALEADPADLGTERDLQAVLRRRPP